MVIAIPKEDKFISDVKVYNENPFAKLKKDMKYPLISGISLGMGIQAFKYGILSTPATFGRMVYAAYPICGLTFLYTGTTYTVAKLRKKDDVLNNLAGVLSTTPLIRKFFNLANTVQLVAATMFLVGMIKVTVQEELSDEMIKHKFTIGADRSDVDFFHQILNKPSSEPLIKRKQYTLFSIPPEEPTQ